MRTAAEPPARPPKSIASPCVQVCAIDGAFVVGGVQVRFFRQAVPLVGGERVRVTGTTCHLVDDRVDTGPIIDQQACRVEPEDTEDTLHERIKVLERRMLVDVLAAAARGELHIEGRKVHLK